MEGDSRTPSFWPNNLMTSQEVSVSVILLFFLNKTCFWNREKQSSTMNLKMASSDISEPLVSAKFFLWFKSQWLPSAVMVMSSPCTQKSHSYLSSVSTVVTYGAASTTSCQCFKTNFPPHKWYFCKKVYGLYPLLVISPQSNIGE